MAATGGHAYVVGDGSLNTLLHLKYNSTMYVERRRPRQGQGAARGQWRGYGHQGSLGTVVWRMHKGGEREFLTDVTDDTPRLVAQGGAGGWGNAHYVSPTNQEPILVPAGRAGRLRGAVPGVEAAGRRGVAGPTQCRQVHPDFALLRGPSPASPTIPLPRWSQCWAWCPPGVRTS